MSVRGEWIDRSDLFATWVALGILLISWCLRLMIGSPNHPSLKKPVSTAIFRKEGTVNVLSQRVTTDDLKRLIQELEEKDAANSWEFVLRKRNDGVSYTAQRREPKDGGPTEYLSTTIFEKCNGELLRDFYMDNQYRQQWDKTVVKHEQLCICKQSGVEVGRTIKKFPLMTAREYVLCWRLWEGQDGDTFYCVIKSCEHPDVPKQKDLVRVRNYLSGWRIRPVVGTSGCEVKMLHREDIGVRREMAKMAFSRGIWSYVMKMEINLSSYALCVQHRHRILTEANAVTLRHKVTTGMEPTVLSETIQNLPAEKKKKVIVVPETNSNVDTGNRNECKKRVTRSVFLVGWAVLTYLEAKKKGSSSLERKASSPSPSPSPSSSPYLWKRISSARNLSMP